MLPAAEGSCGSRWPSLPSSSLSTSSPRCGRWPPSSRASRLARGENTGAGFGIGAGFTWLFAIIAVVVAIVIIRTATRLVSVAWAIALGGLLGGAVGNLIDRLIRPPGFGEEYAGPGQGYVVDFLQLPNWPVFNVADMAIVGSAILMVILTVRGVELSGKPSGAAESPAGAAAQD